ncbi:MAG: hypothetical protein D3907_11780 [Candidatus Electrothrix sp. AUS3]|nr:hypothetical protein [Candidatus Electrothrix gigas]
MKFVYGDDFWKRMLPYLSEVGKVNDEGGKKALNYCRLRALFVSGEKERLFLRRVLFGISGDGDHSYLGQRLRRCRS